MWLFQWEADASAIVGAFERISLEGIKEPRGIGTKVVAVTKGDCEK